MIILGAPKSTNKPGASMIQLLNTAGGVIRMNELVFGKSVCFDQQLTCEAWYILGGWVPWASGLFKTVAVWEVSEGCVGVSSLC